MRRFRIIFLGAALAVATLGVGTSGVAAYGKADQPLAQIEFSANCNNPAFLLCGPPPDGFGLGGIWLWIEIDADGTGDVAGAGCGHDRAGSGGAGPIKGEITWTGGTDIGNSLVPDPNGMYYYVALPGPSGAPPMVLTFPQTQATIRSGQSRGVSIQAQVAP